MEPEEEGFEPVGTLAVMVLLALVILTVWLGMYFGVFLPRNFEVGGCCYL
ncbi:cytochrome c oxidase subunit 2A [Candidatus Pyrohabitans sp.]